MDINKDFFCDVIPDDHWSKLNELEVRLGKIHVRDNYYIDVHRFAYLCKLWALSKLYVIREEDNNVEAIGIMENVMTGVTYLDGDGFDSFAPERIIIVCQQIFEGDIDLYDVDENFNTIYKGKLNG